MSLIGFAIFCVTQKIQMFVTFLSTRQESRQRNSPKKARLPPRLSLLRAFINPTENYMPEERRIQ